MFSGGNQSSLTLETCLAIQGFLLEEVMLTWNICVEDGSNRNFTVPTGCAAEVQVHDVWQ